MTSSPPPGDRPDPAEPPAAVEPAAVEPAAVEPAAVEPAAVEPAAVEPAGELSDREARQREREARRTDRPQGMVPGRARRRSKVERGAMRMLATGGIVGVAVALGAILVGQDVAGWIVGLVIGLTTVILAALLWSSRQL